MKEYDDDDDDNNDDEDDGNGQQTQAVNEVYKEFFTQDFPARAAMQVSLKTNNQPFITNDANKDTKDTNTDTKENQQRYH